MNADAQLEKAVALIDEQIASALRTTYRFREHWNGESSGDESAVLRR